MYGQSPPAVGRFKGRNTAAASTADKILAVAPGAGFRLWVSKITVSNSDASQTTQIQIKTGSTTIWTIPAPAAGGALEIFPDPIDCNENEALNFSCDDSTTTITVSVAGYKAIA